MSRRRRQAGVALITALLITAIATVAAVTMATHQQLDIRRSANALAHDQAYLFALGVESWAGQILMRDRLDGNTDHPGEDWARILPPIEVEGAVVAGRIEDMQGRFNLNNLVDEQGRDSEADIQRFRLLLKALDLDERLADAVADWIDRDGDPRFPDGAEDDVYLGEDPPYRAANAPMASPSELLLVSGFTPETYETIVPHVATLPARTTINVNTATVPVLMALDEGLSETEAQQLIDDRGDEGYQSVEDFLSHPVLRDRGQGITGIGVSSDYFMVHGETRLDRSTIALHSLLERAATGRVLTVMRSQGVL